MAETSNQPEPRHRTANNRRARNENIQGVRIGGAIDINILLGFVFGVTFITIMLAFAVFFPNPAPFQVRVFITVLALAAAGVGAVLPGFLVVRYKAVIRAGGALGLFVIVWFSQPVLEKTVVNLQKPTQSPTPVINEFLADMDSGNISKSYGELDAATKETMVPDIALWQSLYDANLATLGKPVLRTIGGVSSAVSPPGYPVGIYETFSYITKYSGNIGCRQEQVTARATQDNQWRVFSYLISPPLPCLN